MNNNRKRHDPAKCRRYVPANAYQLRQCPLKKGHGLKGEYCRRHGGESKGG